MRAEEIKDKILFQVMNAEKNQELLEQVPHDRYLDLAIVFFYMEEGEDCRQKVYLFDNRQLEYYGLTKERLKTWAMENTPRLLPVSFHGRYFAGIPYLGKDRWRNGKAASVCSHQCEDVSGGCLCFLSGSTVEYW